MAGSAPDRGQRSLVRLLWVLAATSTVLVVATPFRYSDEQWVYILAMLLSMTLLPLAATAQVWRRPSALTRPRAHWVAGLLGALTAVAFLLTGLTGVFLGFFTIPIGAGALAVAWVRPRTKDWIVTAVAGLAVLGFGMLLHGQGDERSSSALIGAIGTALSVSALVVLHRRALTLPSPSRADLLDRLRRDHRP